MSDSNAGPRAVWGGGPARVRVSALFRYESRQLLVIVVIVLALFTWAVSTPIRHGSPLGGYLFLAVALLLLLGHVGRYCYLGATAGMELGRDGVLVRHLGEAAEGREPPEPDGPLARDPRCPGRRARLVGGLYVTTTQKRYFLALALTDGTEVCTLGVAVRYARQRPELEEAHRTVEAARRAATGEREPDSPAERRFRDEVNGLEG